MHLVISTIGEILSMKIRCLAALDMTKRVNNAPSIRATWRQQGQSYCYNYCYLCKSPNHNSRHIEKRALRIGFVRLRYLLGTKTCRTFPSDGRPLLAVEGRWFWVFMATAARWTLPICPFLSRSQKQRETDCPIERSLRLLSIKASELQIPKVSSKASP